MADKAIPGMEFASWTSLPSITETMARQQAGGAKSPLMMIAGKLLEQFNSSGQPPDGSVPAPYMGMGQGLSYPSKTGIDPNAMPNGLTAPNYQMFNQQAPTAPMTLPSLGQPTMQPTDSYTKYLFAPR
jgi:hypothetical protein